MEATCLSETSAEFQQNRWLFMAEDISHRNDRYENFISYTLRVLMVLFVQFTVRHKEACKNQLTYVLRATLITISLNL
jgi:flagellar biosynthesis regulator FlaF